MIALGTLVGTQVHKRNVSEDSKKLERTKEINKAEGKPELGLQELSGSGYKTKEGKEQAKHEASLQIIRAVHNKPANDPGPDYVESPEDPKQVQEELNREFNIPTQSALDSVSKMIESKKRSDQIKSNYKDKVTFETATKNAQLSNGAWNKFMYNTIKKGGK